MLPEKAREGGVQEEMGLLQVSSFPSLKLRHLLHNHQMNANIVWATFLTQLKITPMF